MSQIANVIAQSGCILCAPLWISQVSVRFHTFPDRPCWDCVAFSYNCELLPTNISGFNILQSLVCRQFGIHTVLLQALHPSIYISGIVWEWYFISTVDHAPSHLKALTNFIKNENVLVSKHSIDEHLVTHSNMCFLSGRPCFATCHGVALLSQTLLIGLKPLDGISVANETQAVLTPLRFLNNHKFSLFSSKPFVRCCL